MSGICWPTRCSPRRYLICTPDWKGEKRRPLRKLYAGLTGSLFDLLLILTIHEVGYIWQLLICNLPACSIFTSWTFLLHGPGTWYRLVAVGLMPLQRGAVLQLSPAWNRAVGSALTIVPISSHAQPQRRPPAHRGCYRRSAGLHDPVLHSWGQDGALTDSCIYPWMTEVPGTFPGYHFCYVTGPWVTHRGYRTSTRLGEGHDCSLVDSYISHLGVSSHSFTRRHPCCSVHKTNMDNCRKTADLPLYISTVIIIDLFLHLEFLGVR